MAFIHDLSEAVSRVYMEKSWKSHHPSIFNVYHGSSLMLETEAGSSKADRVRRLNYITHHGVRGGLRHEHSRAVKFQKGI